MSGDPRVLAPLQQAYLLAGDMNTRFSIRQSWRHETGLHGEREETDREIRAWTPTTAEPSLEQRVAELERAQLHTDQSVGTLLDSTAMLRLTDDTLSNDVQSLHERLRVLEEPAQHPEPTGRICSCLKPMAQCEPDGSACVDEPTAPDDPVCAREGCGHPLSLHVPAFDCGVKYDGECIQCGRCSQFLPAPQPAPDLDPVRVEAAAKAAYAAVYPGDEWDEIWPVAQKARIETASRIIRAYMKDGGA